MMIVFQVQDGLEVNYHHLVVRSIHKINKLLKTHHIAMHQSHGEMDIIIMIGCK